MSRELTAPERDGWVIISSLVVATLVMVGIPTLVMVGIPTLFLLAGWAHL